MDKQISVLAGDGIGPEVMEQAIRVLDKIAETYHHHFRYKHALIGGAAYEQHGHHCPSETVTICEQSDAILFGSVGGPVDAQLDEKWKNCEANSLLALRKQFAFNINIRPITMYPSLAHHSPLKEHVIGHNTDIVIFRELIGDIYFGRHTQETNDDGVRYAQDVADYDEHQIRSILQAAFQAAKHRSGKVTSVDKANVLATSKLWRQIANEVHQSFPEVTLEHLYVDNCAMQLIVNPQQFDVLVTGNLFGDILSDLASVLPGSLGLIPSASLNQEHFGMYEPSGGSAPDIAGKGIANPIAQILSVALMLEHSFGLIQEANHIRQAVAAAIDAGHRTGDITDSKTRALSTVQMTDKIIQNI